MSQNPWNYALLAGLGLGAAVEYPNLKLAYNTLGRDVRYVWTLSRAFVLAKSTVENNVTIPRMFRETCKRFPDKPVFEFVETGEVWTFADLDAYSNRVAHLLLSMGFRNGDVLSLYMTNKPKYAAIFLGMSKIGAVAALVNYNIKDEGLRHCITAAESKGVIFDGSLAENLTPDVRAALSASADDFRFICADFAADADGGEGGFPCVLLDTELSFYPDGPVSAEVESAPHARDNAMYIYTSGTTGLPKAAYAPHFRVILAAGIAVMGIQITEDDRIYTCLPLYHSSGMYVGFVAAVMSGCTVILRSKFSASMFWKDCLKHRATCAQYIGEMCRFLLSTPECEEEKQVRLRAMYGNGLPKQVWERFIKRFNVDLMAEFYGATEGNVGTANFVGKVGAVGFIPQLFSFMPMGLVKVDEEGNPVRHPKTGLCIPCAPGEPGELVASIRKEDRGGPKNFKVYVGSKSATDTKVLRDCWKAGDVVFRSGDILVMDEEGWLYFRDRCGDTFRWRGENVSTAEVEGVVSAAAGSREVAVYGVVVPGIEGKAGMAAVHDPDGTLDLRKLTREVDRKLPRYARPVFVRIMRELPLTGTYKLIKRDLQREGFRPPEGEAVYFRGPGDRHYAVLDRARADNLAALLQSSKL